MSKLSGTCKAALAGKQDITKTCHIEGIDSESASMGLELITIAAAEVASEVVPGIKKCSGLSDCWMPTTKPVFVQKATKFSEFSGIKGKVNSLGIYSTYK